MIEKISLNHLKALMLLCSAKTSKSLRSKLNIASESFYFSEKKNYPNMPDLSEEEGYTITDGESDDSYNAVHVELKEILEHLFGKEAYPPNVENYLEFLKKNKRNPEAILLTFYDIETVRSILKSNELGVKKVSFGELVFNSFLSSKDLVVVIEYRDEEKKITQYLFFDVTDQGMNFLNAMEQTAIRN